LRQTFTLNQGTYKYLFFDLICSRGVKEGGPNAGISDNIQQLDFMIL